MKYTLGQIIEKYENGEPLEFVFFWGHTPKNVDIDKSCFSQWYGSPFTVDGTAYKTTEHWMMAHKAALFGDFEIRDKILSSPKPAEVKSLGRKIKGFEEEVWDRDKYTIVLAGNYHKFSQNPGLKSFLLNTNPKVLVEASPVDRIWGIGLAANDRNVENPTLWKGLNLLGLALMETRDLLKELENVAIPDPVLPPWKKYPDIDRYSIGWRMGYGEAHFDEVIGYFNTLDEKQMLLYQLHYPALGDWAGWYEE